MATPGSAPEAPKKSYDWHKEVGGIGPDKQAQRAEFYSKLARLSLGIEAGRGYSIEDLQKAEEDILKMSDLEGKKKFESKIKAGSRLYKILDEYFKDTVGVEDPKKRDRELKLSLFVLSDYGVNVDSIRVGSTVKIEDGVLKIIPAGTTDETEIMGCALRSSGELAVPPPTTGYSSSSGEAAATGVSGGGAEAPAAAPEERVVTPASAAPVAPRGGGAAAPRREEPPAAESPPSDASAAADADAEAPPPPVKFIRIPPATAATPSAAPPPDVPAPATTVPEIKNPLPAAEGGLVPKESSFD